MVPSHACSRSFIDLSAAAAFKCLFNFSGKNCYASGKYFSSFVGFVPARDPALVMLVTMDEPKGAYYASTVAAPTFKATCTRVLRHLNIQPDPVPETGSSTGQKP